MNKLFCSALLAAMIVVPTAAFAQSVMQIDETQVEVVAYEDSGAESSPAQAHTQSVSDAVRPHADTSSETAFNPATALGLNSIYLRH
jgi:hypothetical protein